jgi:hypothetical protein
MTNNKLNELKEKLKKKIEEKKKLGEVTTSKVDATKIGEAVLSPIMLNMKPLERATNEQGKEIVKQTQAIDANVKVLANLVEATKLIAKKTIELKESDVKAKEEEKEVRKESMKLLLGEVKEVAKKIEAQGKYEKPEKINLGETENLLRELVKKEFPEMPEMDLSVIEGELKKLANKKVDFKEITKTLGNIYDILLKAWLPSENAIQVIVKNQVKPGGGGGGIIPFQDSSRNPVKPLVDSDGYLLTNTNNVLVDEKYDYVSVGYPDGTTEVYTFKYGGATGDTVATVTIVYTDSSKDNVSTVTKI